MATNVGEAGMQAANARASGYMGGANALSSGLGTGANLYMQGQMMNRMFPQQAPTYSYGAFGGGSGTFGEGQY